MAYTQTQLVQMAFSQLSTPYLASDADNDNTDNAAMARLAWDAMVPWSLTKYDWKFATKRSQLSQLVGVDIPQPWQFAYQIPSQALGILSVWPRGQYAREENMILSNTSPLFLDYRYTPSVNKWPPYFAMHIMYKLAEFMAPSLTQDATTKKELAEKSALAESQALAANGQQQTAIPVQSAPAITCRYAPAVGDYNDYSGYGGY